MGEFDGMPDWMVERIMQKKTAHERLNRQLPDDHPEVRKMKMLRAQVGDRVVRVGAAPASEDNLNPVDVDGVPLYGPLADAVREASIAERDRQLANIRNNIHPERGQPGRDMTTARRAAIAKWKAENPDG